MFGLRHEYRDIQTISRFCGFCLHSRPTDDAVTLLEVVKAVIRGYQPYFIYATKYFR